MARLDGKVVLITGGESGIGLATARLFVAEGARVHLVGIDGEKLGGAVDELGAGAASSAVADVTDEDAVKAAVAAGVERHGRYDVLFSNAGISGAVAPIVEYPSDVFARTIAVHILGAFHVIKHGAPHVPDGGSIVITSSVTGLIGPPGVSAYVAAKHGQVGLMRTAAKELAERRIRVNTLHPGPTSTPFQDDIEMRATGQSQQDAAKIFDGMIPLGRHATPEEVASAVLYLASDESAMVTSHTLSIDGGMSG
jgi:NAD(P)-dependent dehydrogenase (short-subunit alcohol dehydrogenase family)